MSESADLEQELSEARREIGYLEQEVADARREIGRLECFGRALEKVRPDLLGI